MTSALRDGRYHKKKKNLRKIIQKSFIKVTQDWSSLDADTRISLRQDR